MNAVTPRAAAPAAAARANTAPAVAPQPPPGVPVAIYVADFDLDPEAFHADKGGPLQQLRPGLIGSLIKGNAGSKDPVERAHALVDLMGRTLVQNLTAAGLNARRLAPGELQPKQGWLVHGRFTTSSPLPITWIVWSPYWVSTRLAQAVSNWTPSIEVTMSIRFGGTPISGGN